MVLIYMDSLLQVAFTLKSRQSMKPEHNLVVIPKSIHEELIQENSHVFDFELAARVRFAEGEFTDGILGLVMRISGKVKSIKVGVKEASECNCCCGFCVSVYPEMQVKLAQLDSYAILDAISFVKTILIEPEPGYSLEETQPHPLLHLFGQWAGYCQRKG